MYANEWNGRFPPLNPVPHNWMLDGWAVYPEYLTDLSVFICPDSPFADDYTFRLRDDFDHRGAIIGSYHPDCLSSLFYNYTGYFIESNEMAAAVFNAYYEMPYEAFVNHCHSTNTSSRIGPSAAMCSMSTDTSSLSRTRITTTRASSR